jgi:uncharacterized protein (DUF1778 family)
VPRVAVQDNKRMQLRVRPAQKAMLMRAAALRNVDLTDFIVQLALREAQTVIEQSGAHSVIGKRQLAGA